MKKEQAVTIGNEEDKVVSIYDMEEWPGQHSNKLPFTPKDIKEVITLYSETKKPIRQIIEEKGIRYSTFCDLLCNYPTVCDDYLRAQKNKALIYSDNAQEIYENEIPEQFFEQTTTGTKLSMAGIKYMKDKYEARMRQAEIHETGSFVRKTQIESKSLNVNANVTVSPDQLDNLSASALLGEHKKTSR